MSEWVAAIAGGLGFFLSIYNLRRQHIREAKEDDRRALAEKRARVTVAFHWLPEHARVVVEGREYRAGYHLVLSNQGPADAREVEVKLFDPSGSELQLLSLDVEELPLAVLSAGSKYPIPWIYEPFARHQRRFKAKVTWSDDDQEGQTIEVPLRRGQVAD